MGSTKLCGWLGLLFVVSSIVSFIGFSNNVSAASIFDNLIETTDEVPIKYQGTKLTNVSSVSDVTTLINNHCVENAIDTYNLSNRITIVYERLAFDTTSMRIGLDTEDSASIEWIGDTNYQQVNATNLTGQIVFEAIGSDIEDLRCFWQPGERTQTIGSSDFDIYLFMTELDPNYPVDYEGEGLPTKPPAGKEDLYPHFTYLVTDKEIKATHDLTQQLPDLPEPDEDWENNQWQIMWYLFKCSSIDDDDIIDCPDRESVHSELLERDEIYEWEVDDYGDYLLTAEFRYQSCQRSPSWPETPDYCYLNSEHDEFSFVPGRTVYLPIDGMNITGNTADLNCDVAGNCYDDTRFKDCNVIVAIATLSFDDFNYADCLENISLLANMLSFNTIKFSNSWVSSGNCYTLGTLGNWLNLDNKRVCPYFSNEVRNTVTPFITFILGLIMVRFIAGKGAHGSREVDI